MGASSLSAGKISISLTIFSAIVLLFAETILLDIKSNGPPKQQQKE